MYINADTIITTASVITALVVIFSAIFGVYRWYQNQNRQDKDIARLMQLGANHTVPIAKDKLDKYINLKAHEQEE